MSDITGIHTLKYTVVNPKTKEVINEKTIKLNVVLKLFYIINFEVYLYLGYFLVILIFFYHISFLLIFKIN